MQRICSCKIISGKYLARQSRNQRTPLFPTFALSQKRNLPKKAKRELPVQGRSKLELRNEKNLLLHSSQTSRKRKYFCFLTQSHEAKDLWQPSPRKAQRTQRNNRYCAFLTTAPLSIPKSSSISAVEVLGRTLMIFTLPISTSSLPSDSLVSGSISSSPMAKTCQLCPTAISVPSPRLMVICFSFTDHLWRENHVGYTICNLFSHFTGKDTSISSFGIPSLVTFGKFSKKSFLLIWRFVDSSNLPVVASYIFPTHDILITRLVTFFPDPGG